MIKNTIISLDPKSATRTDAVNTIKYTLLLDYSCPKTYNTETLINDVMNSCHTCCSGLFGNKKIKYNFFGQPGLDNLPELLQHLNYESFPEHNKNFTTYSSLSEMILQHCILSSYHALVTDLFSDQTLTSYSLANIVKKDGIQALKGKSWYLENDQLIFKTRDHNLQSRMSSHASDFNRLFNNRLKSTPGIFNFCKSDDRFLFATSAFSYQIKEMKIPLIKTLFKPVSKASEANSTKPEEQSQREIPNLQAFSAYNSIIAQLYDCKRYNNVVDMVYQKYLTEHIFDIHLLFSLIKTILFTEKNSQFRFDSKIILDTISICQSLPNVFSRQLFTKYAFDHIFSGSDCEYTASYNDFWFEHNPQYEFRYDNVHTLKVPHMFSFPKWLEQYQLFMRYMSTFVIPVYEWCFINMLLETIELKYPNRNHTFHLYNAIELLASYMTQNYKKLLTPIEYSQPQNDFFSKAELKKRQKELGRSVFKNLLLPQELSISNPMNWLELTATKTTYDRANILFKNLFSAFYQTECEKELNLTPLNPSYFKEVHKTSSPNSLNPYSNMDYLRNCYIDLIHYDRLT